MSSSQFTLKFFSFYIKLLTFLHYSFNFSIKNLKIPLQLISGISVVYTYFFLEILLIYRKIIWIHRAIG